MNPSLRVVYRQVDRSEALSALIEDEYHHLCDLSPKPIGCRVTVNRISHARAPQLRVRAEVELHDTTLIVDRVPVFAADTDPYVETRAVFRALRRQLNKYLKNHAPRAGERLVVHAPQSPSRR